MSSHLGAGLPVTLELPVLNYERFSLDNGLTVVVQSDRRTPIVAMALWYHIGSANEPHGATGFAHLFEHLMFSGSENHRGSFFEPFAHVGATDLNGTTWFDRTNYFVTVPSTALDMAMWLESDRMGHLLGAIGEPELEAQKGVVKNEKRQNQNAPYGHVDEVTQRAVYPANHPYHHITIGSMDDIDAATLEDVRRWFLSHYGAANATLVLAGDIDVSTAREKANLYFGDIQPGPPQLRLAPWIAPLDQPVRDVMTDRVPSIRIYRRWNVPGLGHADTPLLLVAAAALGRGRASRLRRRLVDGDASASNAVAFMQPFALAGQFGVTVDLAAGTDPNSAEAAISDEVRRLIEEGPTPDEIECARNDMVAAFVRSLENVGGMEGRAFRLAEGQTLQGDPLTRLEDFRRIATATPEEVRMACQRWITGNHYTLTVLPGPAQSGFAETNVRRPIDGGGRVTGPAEHSFSASGRGVERRGGPPQVANFPDVRFPPAQRRTLSNGIEVTLAERGGTGNVEVRLQFGDGGMLDAGWPLGSANFMWSVLVEGTETCEAVAIEQRRQRLGARLSPTALGAMTGQLGPSLALMSDLVRRPAFDEAAIARVRPRLLATEARMRTDPNAIAQRVLSRSMFGAGHPYGEFGAQVGTPESIAAIDRTTLHALHRARIRPDNLRIFAAGDVGIDELVRHLEASFGDWASPPGAVEPMHIGRVAQRSKPVLALVDRPGAGQSLILGGLVLDVPGATLPLAGEIANGVFGGLFSSRLNMNLREHKHWAYGAYSGLLPDVVQSRLTMSASVQSDKTAAALLEMIAEVDAIAASRPPTVDEVKRVKAHEIRTLSSRFETSAAIVDRLVQNAIDHRSDDYVDTFKQAVEALRLDEVAAAAQALFVQDAMTWVIVGDLDQVAASLRETGLDVQVFGADGRPL